MSPIRVGAPAPKLSLKDQDGRVVDLAELRGKNVLLSFHPLAWTSVCLRQMEALEMNFETFETAGCVALGVSVDPVPSKKAWAESMHVEKTRLLSDFWPHGAAAQAFGIFREGDGFSERAAIVVDADGIVRFVKVYPMKEVPDVGELLRVVQGLQR
ncbi:MAG: redoxin domain-containing protein [Candidatus Bipolaricaulota bacterium]